MCSRNVLAGFLIAAVLCALSGRVAAQGTWAVEKTFHIGGDGGWDYVTVDAKNHRLYVPRSTHTMVIDADSGKTLADIPGQKHNHGVALVPDVGRGFISDGSFRRSELVGLEMSDVQKRQEHWAIVDLIGKGGHIRTVPIPEWVKRALDEWTVAARITDGKIFRRVSRTGKVWGKAISQNVVWYVVKGCCEKAGLERIAPHDLRRTCAKLCHSSGGEIEQIQFLLGHASVQTTERYLGCKQNLGHPVNDRFNLVTVVGASADQQQAESMQTTGAGDTIRRGECDHAQPANALRSRHLFEDARPALVTEREDHCASSIRSRPASRVGSDHPRSEADGNADQGARRTVGT